MIQTVVLVHQRLRLGLPLLFRSLEWRDGCVVLVMSILGGGHRNVDSPALPLILLLLVFLLLL